MEQEEAGWDGALQRGHVRAARTGRFDGKIYCESAPVCGLIELCKASCSFGGEVYMILVETVTVPLSNQPV